MEFGPSSPRHSKAHLDLQVVAALTGELIGSVHVLPADACLTMYETVASVCGSTDAVFVLMFHGQVLKPTWPVRDIAGLQSGDDIVYVRLKLVWLPLVNSALMVSEDRRTVSKSVSKGSLMAVASGKVISYKMQIKATQGFQRGLQLLAGFTAIDKDSSLWSSIQILKPSSGAHFVYGGVNSRAIWQSTWVGGSSLPTLEVGDVVTCTASGKGICFEVNNVLVGCECAALPASGRDLHPFVNLLGAVEAVELI